MSALAYDRYDPRDLNAMRFFFNAVSRDPLSWKEEIYAAARYITNSATEPLWLCFSGGIDSEIMCRAFYDQGLNFSVLTLAHEGGTNKHDIKYAIEWCKARGVRHTIVSVDIESLAAIDGPSYASDGYVADNLFRYMQLKIFEIAESFGGRAVLGGGEQLYKVRSAGGRLEAYLDFDAGFAVPLEWCSRKRAHHEPYFYFSTPELVLSYLRIPIIQHATDEPSVFAHPANSYLLKKLVYHAIWPDVEPRFKYHGFENVLTTLRSVKETFLMSHPPLRACALPVSELRKQLTTETTKRV